MQPEDIVINRKRESISFWQLGDKIEFVMGHRLYWNREKSHRIIPEVLQILPKSTWATEVCNMDEGTLDNAQV